MDDDLPDTTSERALMLQEMIVGLAESPGIDQGRYGQLRQELMANPTTKELLPGFVRTTRTGSTLRGYLQGVSAHWQPRRDHVRQAFGPLLDFLDASSRAPLDAMVSAGLLSFDAAGVQQAWQKALERRERDPEGAITAARALLETLCKHILDDGGVPYGANDDLPKLYHQAASQLNLSPQQHTEEVFRSILGSCQQIVNGLGTLRNRLGDAHGHGRLPVKPSARHAALAVNLAGTMATFLVETWLSARS